jgi:hypothetical protein
MGQTVGGAVDYNAAMDVTTATLPDATGGQTYRAQLTAACGVTPYMWRRTSGSLPIGLKLKSSGMIMGIPYKKDAAGTYTFAVVAKDSATPRHTATKVLTLVLAH